MTTDSAPRALIDLVSEDRATVAQVLLARAERTPENLFLLAGPERYSYAEAVASARRFAGLALKLGLERGSRVASYLGNRPECFWAWFGTYVAGGTYVPINRAHRGTVLADMLSRSSAEILVVDASALESLPGAESTGVKTLIVTGTDEEVAAFDGLGYQTLSFAETYRCEEGAVATLWPSDIANVMYTSGTTGRSKAVLVPHNQLCRGGARVVDAAALSAADVIHGWIPLFHLGGQQDGVMPIVLVGAGYALYPTFSLSRFWDEIKESGATIFGGFSALIELIWGLPERDDDGDNSLRLGLIGLIPPTLHEKFEKRFGLRLIELYGLTEAEPLAMPRPDETTPIGSCGRPTPDFEVTIVDESDVPVPAGSQGEIVARPRVPDVMMRAYEEDDAATLEAFRNLWFHTGDIGYFDEEGFLYFVDRQKHAIRRRGENVSSWEVEGVLRQHEEVADVAVIGVPSPLGEDDIKAFVARRAGSSLTEGELFEFCTSHMAKFMVPRFIVFIRELPYTETGKLRKESLDGSELETWDAEVASKSRKIRPVA